MLFSFVFITGFLLLGIRKVKWRKYHHWALSWLLHRLSQWLAPFRRQGSFSLMLKHGHIWKDTAIISSRLWFQTWRYIKSISVNAALHHGRHIDIDVFYLSYLFQYLFAALFIIEFGIDFVSWLMVHSMSLKDCHWIRLSRS